MISVCLRYLALVASALERICSVLDNGSRFCRLRGAVLLNFRGNAFVLFISQVFRV